MSEPDQTFEPSNNNGGSFRLSVLRDLRWPFQRYTVAATLSLVVGTACFDRKK